jgi:hypothetical protein
VVTVHHRRDRIELRRERFEGGFGPAFGHCRRDRGHRKSLPVERHGVQEFDGLLESLQLGRPSLLEPDAAHLTGELRCGSRHEHLAGCCLRTESSRHVQGHSSEAALDRNGIAGIDTDADW